MFATFRLPLATPSTREDGRAGAFCAHLLFCSKNIERIGDHATNIAETVVYLVTGVPMSSERPRGRQETDIDVEAAGGDA
jgi:phosphate transport system protein